MTSLTVGTDPDSKLEYKPDAGKAILGQKTFAGKPTRNGTLGKVGKDNFVRDTICSVNLHLECNGSLKL